MAYFLALFYPETYEAFTNSSRDIAGFRRRNQRAAGGVEVGDKLVCYVAKLSRWVGILEVRSKWFKEETPVFYPEDDPFVIRFQVQPLAWLPKQKGIPIRDDRVWQRLSFTREADKTKSQWTGKLRTSLTQLDDGDGRFIEEFIMLQASDGELFEIDEQEYQKLFSNDAGDELNLDDRKSAAFASAWFARQFPDPTLRRKCAMFMARALEVAHSTGANRWRIGLKNRRLRLVVGKLVAIQLASDSIRIGIVPDHLSSDMKLKLDEVGEWLSEHDTTPVTRLIQLPIESFFEFESSLHANFTEFVNVAASTVNKTIRHKSHSPGVIAYLQDLAGRTLPEPVYEESETAAVVAMPKAVALKTARALFNKVDYELSHLLSAIDTGDIGLPDLQRPFVWSSAKVRDLFDSMYRGFPIGYLLFWSNSQLRDARPIGIDTKQQKIPRLVIVDGQQRLTSLYAVLRSKLVLDEHFNQKRIEIAFRPRDGKFEVTDAAVRKDPEFITSISEMWGSGTTSWSVVNQFLTKLRVKRTVDPEDEEAMSHNIDRLFSLHGYSLTALEIVAEVEEQEVADIFVRINSEGIKLNQADFILTLLSVFWQEGRLALEEFARLSRIPPTAAGKPSPFNYVFQPSPDQLLRVEIATGFYRARLRSVYQVLRGKNLETSEFSKELRDAQFERLRSAQRDVLDLNSWHDYLSVLTMAGYRTSEMISSRTAVLYTYAIYLIGKLRCDTSHHALHRLIGRWFVMTSLSARYTGSSETIMEEDLSRLRSVQTSDAFITLLEGLIGNSLTSDFWRLTLPAQLESSAARNPAFLAYIASQCQLGTQVLFSDKRVADVMDPALRPSRKTIDRHHLFPRAWLQRNGIKDLKIINQVANFAYVEWPDNLSIKDLPPKDYVPRIREQFSEHKWIRMCRENALPEGWEEMPYDEFLQQRRVLMAQLIRNGFDSIGKTERTAEGGRAEEGTASEQAVWKMIESAELQMRKVVRRLFDEMWGSAADTRMYTILGAPAVEVIGRNRSAREKQYRFAETTPTDQVLDFCYLGQLIQLMISGDSWELFKRAFSDKRELQDLAKAISPVRNDRAHFRSVPDNELLRSRVAVTDLAARLSMLEQPAAQGDSITA